MKYAQRVPHNKMKCKRKRNDKGEKRENTQELWGNFLIQNICIIGVLEGEKRE